MLAVIDYSKFFHGIIPSSFQQQVKSHAFRHSLETRVKSKVKYKAITDCDLG